MLKGRLNLEGLPQGRYQLKVLLQLGSRAVDRSAPMTMASLDTTLQQEVARINTRARHRMRATSSTCQSRGARLGLRAAVLHRDAEPSSRSGTSHLSEDAKRRYLTEFWQSRDPNKGTPQNETREQFYAAIAFANKNYKERNVPGWKTDRGRIYAKNGVAPSILAPRADPARATVRGVELPGPGPGKWYIFADRTGVGNWRLLVSSDLKEPKQPDWRDILTEDGVREAGRFLNVDFYSSSTAVQVSQVRFRAQDDHFGRYRLRARCAAGSGRCPWRGRAGPGRAGSSGTSSTPSA